MKRTQTLQSLHLRGNALKDEGLEMLAEAIRENKSLEELDVSINEITPVGISGNF